MLPFYLDSVLGGCPMSSTFEQRKLAFVKAAQRQYQHAFRRLNACKEELAICRDWAALFHEGSLLQANLYRIKKGMREISVADWLAEGQARMIALDPLLSPGDQVAGLFRLSKKRSTAIFHLEKQVELRERSCEALHQTLLNVEAIDSEEALQAWIAENVSQKKASLGKSDQTPLPYHEFYTASGLPIRVGKGAKSNESLTFRHSKGSDWWFHVQDYPGSHVVLVLPKGQEPDAESVQDALLLALAYSKARDEKEADIVVTQCKHVNRLRGGALGKVQLGKHKVMFVKQNAERLVNVKKRCHSLSSSKR